MLTNHQMQGALSNYFRGRGFGVHFEAMRRRPLDDLEFFIDLAKHPSLRIAHCPCAAKVSMPELWGDRPAPGHVFLLDSQDRILDTLVVRNADEMSRALRHFLPLEIMDEGRRRKSRTDFDPVAF